MREIVSYHAKQHDEASITLTRCLGGIVDDLTTTDWQTAIDWLLRPPAGEDTVFAVVYSLMDFTRALFSLLPAEERTQIEKEDRIVYQDTKIFYVNGRYLGLTATVPVNAAANRYRRDEVNIYALKWWLSEDEGEPADVQAVYTTGMRILQVLDTMKILPTKLTSPVAVFTDCYLGDSSRYPTIWSFNGDHFGAMEYATEMMRYEWRSAYQVGHFPETHLYDQVSAYPSSITNLPSTDKCRCEHSTTKPSWADWGIVYGEVDVQAEISPLVYTTESGSINPKGRWKGYFTTKEIACLEKWGAGTFTLEDGWFFQFGGERPYKSAMYYLYPWKQHPDSFTSTIAKKMSQGMSGKLDEDRQDGKKGDFYNPILAAMVRSHCRVKVADFIYRSNLQDDLLAVMVDSVLATSKVSIPTSDRMGAWRYEGQSPAVVLGKGSIWRPGKRPQGIGYEQLLEALKRDPDAGYYEFTTASGSIRAVDLLLDGADPDRIFDQTPESGRDILTKISHSSAIALE